MSLWTFFSRERTTLWRRIHNRWRVLAVGLLLGLVPLVLLRSRLFQPGFPYPGDFISNMFPPLIVRWHLSHGQLPLYTHLWYGGEYILFNPLFKGFYPVAWPLYIPGIPLLPVAKAVVGLHYVAAVAIAYWYASKEFPWWIAVPFALLFVTPMMTFVGHIEKVFGWPWLVLFAWHITDRRMRTSPMRNGAIAGIALGMALLAGDSYHVFYGGILLATLVVVTRGWKYGLAAAAGSLVSLPKVLFSIIPTLLMGTNRPHIGQTLSPEGFFAGLVGFGPGTSQHLLEIHSSISMEGAGIVGLGALCIAAGVVAIVYVDPERLSIRSRWIGGVLVAGVISLLLVTRWSYLYWLPVVSTFRVGARAIVLASLCVLLLCWAGAKFTMGRSQMLRLAVAGLLILSAVNAVGVWTVVNGGSASQPTIDDRVADDIAATGCSDVWVEGGLAGNLTPYRKQIAFGLLERGIALQAANYGKIGQEYTAQRDGHYTFGVLLVGTRLTQSRYNLTAGWGKPVRGTVFTEQLTLYRSYQTDNGPIYVYLTPQCE